MTPWHEDDGFWETFYPAMFSDARWDLAEGEVQSALTLLGVAGPVDILDFCCGPGRHTVAMGKLGHRVLGVDRIASYLNIGRQKAVAAGVDVVFEQGDVRAFRRAEAFDCALSLYTSFGYFEAPADDVKVLENAYASLRSGGRLLMDLSGKEVVARSFTQRTWSEPEPGMVWLEDRKVLPEWAGIENKWTLIRGEERSEYVLSIRLYSAAELKAALLGVGFSHVDLFGSLKRDPYDQTARRLVAVGVK
jgi:SAM-dependent methyltransferase